MEQIITEQNINIISAKYKKIDLYKSFWIFVIGSVFGFVAETIWCLIKNGSIVYREGFFSAYYPE